MKNLHLLPTDKPSRLVLDTVNNSLFLTTTEDFGTNIMKFQNIYITSDEVNGKVELLSGECIIHNGKIHEVIENKGLYISVKELNHIDIRADLCKKIILTTDQELIADGVQAIDEDFLNWFVKNSSCEEVEVLKLGRFNKIDCYKIITRITINKNCFYYEIFKNFATIQIS